MSWARLDDRGAWHPKIMQAGNAAYGVWCRCLQMCALGDTRGFVPRALAEAIAGTDHDALDRLTEAKLWVAVTPGQVFSVTERHDTGRRALPDVQVTIPGDGFFIRDFLHFNRCSADDGSRSPAREHPTNGSGADVVRAPAAPQEVQKRSAPNCSPPTRPVPCTSPPLPPPSSEEVRAKPAPLASGDPARPDPGAARALEARGSAQGADAGHPADPEIQSRVEAVAVRLAVIGWRSKTRASKRFGVDAWTGLVRQIVVEQGLTVDDVDRLWELAQTKARASRAPIGDTSREPANLFGAWVHPGGATWKDVLAEQAMHAKEADVRHRGGRAQAEALKESRGNTAGDPRPLGELGPIYGEVKP